MPVHFDEAAHVYTLDGVQLPSVTQVLAAEGFIDARFYDEWSRDRGSLVHLACHLDDIGDLDESSVDPAIAPFLEAYRAFKQDAGFVASRSEVPMASATYRFAGTPDKLGSLRDTSCVLIDIKTGGVQPWAAIQTAAYEILAEAPYRRFVLQLRKDGQYRLHPHTNRHDRQVFLSALAVHHWKNANMRRNVS